MRVLVAEDNPADIGLIRVAFEHHGLNAHVTVQADGEQMLRYIERIDAGEVPCPEVVLLDLNLPRVNGHTLLRRLRQSAACAQVPVLIVSSSNAPEDRYTASRLGAAGYFCKPNDFDEFMRLGELVRHLLSTSSNSG